MSQNTEQRARKALVRILTSATGLLDVPVRFWTDGAEDESFPAVLVNVDQANQEPEDSGKSHLMSVGADIAVQTDLAYDLSASQCGNLLGYVRDRMKSATLADTLTREMSATVFDWDLEPGSREISMGEVNMRSLRIRMFLVER